MATRKEYIDRGALLQDIEETALFTVRGGEKTPTSEMRGARKVIGRIEAAPTADVVEVVRCSQCKHWYQGDCYRLELSRPDDYCSYGERKENENDRHRSNRHRRGGYPDSGNHLLSGGSRRGREDGQEMSELKPCLMRHKNGNCLPCGGFCTAVNDPICEALHNAYDAGCRAAFLGAQQGADIRSHAVSNDDLLTTLRERARGLEFSLRWLILEAVHRLECAIAAQQAAEKNEPLTLDQLRKMDEVPIYVQTGSGKEEYVILVWEYGSVMLYGIDSQPIECDPDFYNMRHNDPDGHFGLHILGWLAYRYKPVDGKEQI